MTLMMLPGRTPSDLVEVVCLDCEASTLHEPETAGRIAQQLDRVHVCAVVDKVQQATGDHSCVTSGCWCTEDRC